jgi:hypothetical protein
VEDALRSELNRGASYDAPPVPVFTQGTGPRPGIDLSSNRAMHEVLDEGSDLEHMR